MRFQIRDLWRAIKRHPVANAIGWCLALYGLLATDYLQDFDALTRNLRWLVESLGNIWMRLVILALGLGLIAWGAWRAGRAESLDQQHVTKLVSDLL
jgi:hypothetical protein